MRRAALAVSAVTTFALISVAGCKKEEVTSYRVPKDPEPAAAKMPNDHVHAGVAKSGSAGAGSAGAAKAPASQAPQTAPAPAGGSAMANTPVATASGAGLAWKGPGHWQDKGASGMRKGTFAISGEGGSGELSITAFPGDVGGEVANVNRWRGQVSLPPQSPDEVAKAIQRLEANGLKIGVVDMTGKDPAGKPTRVLGAFVPHGGSTWFFKFTGPEALVAKEQDAFFAFLKTIKPAA